MYLVFTSHVEMDVCILSDASFNISLITFLLNHNTYSLIPFLYSLSLFSTGFCTETDLNY